MITAIVEFKVAQPVTLDEARKIFLSTAPKYQKVEGLIRKMYIRSEDGMTVGGIYLWRSKSDAEAAYTEEWHAFVSEKYGKEPNIRYLESPVVVDNTTQQIISD